MFGLLKTFYHLVTDIPILFNAIPSRVEYEMLKVLKKLAHLDLPQLCTELIHMLTFNHYGITVFIPLNECFTTGTVQCSVSRFNGSTEMVTPYLTVDAVRISPEELFT